MLHILSLNKLQFEQHFCTDGKIIKNVVRAAHLQKDDIILEIGSGTGNLTRELAPQVKKVIAIEIDRSLQSYLADLPPNVEVRYGHALALLPSQQFQKVVANIPYQICEPLLQSLCLRRGLTLAVLLVPKKFATHVSSHPIFSAFFDFKLVQDVPPEAFSPPPKVTSAILKITPAAKEDDNAFIRRKLHLQRDKKVQNAVRDTLIDLFSKHKKSKHQKKLTKKQALSLMSSLRLPKETVAKLTLSEFQSLALSVEKLARQ